MRRGDLFLVAKAHASSCRGSRFLCSPRRNPIGDGRDRYPLPRAHAFDRFAFKISVESPKLDDLLTILDCTTGTAVPKPQRVMTAATIEK